MGSACCSSKNNNNEKNNNTDNPPQNNGVNPNDIQVNVKGDPANHLQPEESSPQVHGEKIQSKVEDLKNQGGGDHQEAANTKVHGTVIANQPMEKPTNSGKNFPNSLNHVDASGQQIPVIQNPFEIVHKNDPTTNKDSQDIFLDMTDIEYKKMEDLSKKKQIDKDKELQNITQGSKAQSTLMEWAKVLQKQFNQEKNQMNNNTESKALLMKAYRTILQLKDRHWYEEMTQLYKEKNHVSKSSTGMSSLTFDRKLLQLQEQFRWLISAVANVKFNFNSQVGVWEFPPFRSSHRPRKMNPDKFDSSSASIIKGYSDNESENNSEIDSPTKVMLTSNKVPKQSQIACVDFGSYDKDPRKINELELPDIFSPTWQNGFIWNGVYMKLYSKEEAASIKKELRILKHIAIECLQTETSIKVQDFGSQSPNESKDPSRQHTQFQFLNVIMPLSCIVESSSWVLFGTPIFPVKNQQQKDDLQNRMCQEVCNNFKNSLLLNSLTPKNYKIYQKVEESGGNSNDHNTSLKGSFLGGLHNTSIRNDFLLVSKVDDLCINLPRVDLMFILNQESNAPVTFIDYPHKGILESELVKKLLNCTKLDVSLNILQKKDPKKDNKPYYFDIVKFKRLGWKLQMVYLQPITGNLPHNFHKNKRAVDLLATSNSKCNMDIRGNVLIFATYYNKNSIYHPYFISDQLANPSFVLEELKEQEKSKSMYTKPNANAYINDLKNHSGNTGLKIQQYNQDDKAFNQYMVQNLAKSINNVIEYLENTDNIQNHSSLKELFHRNGLNMRFEWLVYTKLKRHRMKALVGSDILARCLKQILNGKTSKMMRKFSKKKNVDFGNSFGLKEKMEMLVQEKNEFLIEGYFKKLMCTYLNVLIKGTNEEGQQQQTGESDFILNQISTDLFLMKARIIDFATKVMDATTRDKMLSSEIITNIMNVACLDANLFFDAIEYHFKICFNYELIRQIRNDKYVHWISNNGQAIKPSEISVIFNSYSHLSIRERCFTLLLKLLPVGTTGNNLMKIELTVPAALYKMRSRIDMDSQSDSLLRDFYELPDIETLNDWIVLLNSILNDLFCPDGAQNFLIEAYIMQLVMAFFGENDPENQLSYSILEKINTFINNTPVCSPELMITIHTWFGILTENKMFVECEQSYTMALLSLHRLYGDPRGRGQWGTPWELFITWRLSILSRLQGKIHDAEYAEELFDATAVGLRPSAINQHVKNNPIYTNLFKYYTHNNIPKNQDHLDQKINFKNLALNDHPFPYWTNNLVYDENVSKIEVITSTMHKTAHMLRWMMTQMLIFQNTGKLWNTGSLREFYLAIMQNSFSNTTSVSSISGFSMDGRGKDGSSTPKNSGMKSFDKRKDRFQGGNLVQIFEKDSSTLNKKELNGVVYSWGQNNDGQVGNPIASIQTDERDLHAKKMRIYYPKTIMSLKDTIITNVACGHTHSMAITINRRLLAWGCNKANQLGLGSKAPSQVYIPTMVQGIEDVKQVSCGTEHTVALTEKVLVYSWGQGEGGLLGHGDTKSHAEPKLIQSLKNHDITSITCGSLHTVALTKSGHVFSWGRSEGGQLGISFDQLTNNTKTNEVYLLIPKRVTGVIENIKIVQLACGETHTLALAHNGQVYGWGYTNAGQLGLGVSQDNYEHGKSPYGLQIREPVLIEKLHNIKITEVFAGSTFSMFLNDKKELYACGLNDYNQLGLEKQVTIINTTLDHYRHITSSKNTECLVPRKIDCFPSAPILNVACGENHSLALVFQNSSYMLFAWGMQKQGQLGTGDTQASYCTPRSVSFLQQVMMYSMCCGAYHSLVVLGEASKTFKKDALLDRLEKKIENRWTSNRFEQESSYEAMIDVALNNLENVIPSEEGRIDNPKAIKKI